MTLHQGATEAFTEGLTVRNFDDMLCHVGASHLIGFQRENRMELKEESTGVRCHLRGPILQFI